jgi:hypothetical protein
MSTLNVSNITDGTTTLATSYVVNGSAKAWAAYSQTGTQSIRNSQNISSITDLGTGISEFAIISSFANANWAHVACSGELSGGGNRSVGLTGAFGALTSSKAIFRNFLLTNTSNDDDGLAFALMGELA